MNTIFDWIGGALNAWTLYEKLKEKGIFSFFINIGKKKNIEAERKIKEKLKNKEITTIIDKDIINVAINYERNKKWLNWFLERHKTFLPNFEGKVANFQQEEVIKEYFTTREQKIISCGLSHLYMMEKFHTYCLREAPNLPLSKFQELCFFWWASELNDYPILAKKGSLSKEEEKKLDKYLHEKNLQKWRRKVRESLDTILESYLKENQLPVPEWYFDYQKENDIAKRAEVYKKVDIHDKEFQKVKIKKIKEFYKKNKDMYPELEKTIKEKIKEERESIKDLEERIKTFDYLRWSESYMYSFLKRNSK